MIAAVSLAIFAEPLVAWDARSIWFFHAKAIFFDHGLHTSDFWLNEEYNWSHKYYPQLTSMLAARYADFIVAGWNEYAPKGALVPLAASSILGLLAISKNWLQFLLALVAAVALAGGQFYNGHQDGWLALYGCVAICALARWSLNNKRQDLMLGIAALAMALCLKNEGQLLLVAALVPLLYGALLHRARLGVRELTQRLFFLAQKVTEDTFLLESTSAFLVVGLCVRVNKGDLLVGIPAALYTTGVIAVYLGTPYDFEWHVMFSLDRVTLFPTLLLLIGLIQMTPRLFAGLRYVDLRAFAARSLDKSGLGNY
jgi:hypothetical protein